MSDQQLHQCLEQRYQELGIAGLSYPSLKTVPGLYVALNSRGIKLRDVIKRLGFDAEYQNYKATNFVRIVDGKEQLAWSWERVIATLTKIVEQTGFLPTANWCQINGYGSLVQYVYSTKKNWSALRDEFQSFEHSDFVQSRNGMRWHSRAEASLSNFLYARGINHKIGEKYSADYQQNSGFRYGVYDLHFTNSEENWVDVEVWGDRPNGHDEIVYAQKRKAKEAFNKNNSNFLGIHYRDCYDDTKLERVLAPHIGVIAPFNFEKPRDRIIQTVHWTDADELLEYCKTIADAQPDGRFPSEDWLRKRGRWRNRNGTPYNTVSTYIKQWLGGVRRVRELLGQAHHSTQQWDRESVLKAYLSWYESYGFTPGQARKINSLSDKERKTATNIATAAVKYVGNIKTVHQALEINPAMRTKWNKPVILELIKKLHDQHGLSPHQVGMLDASQRATLNVSDSDFTLAKQASSRIGFYCGSLEQAFSELGITPWSKRSTRSPMK